MLLVYSFRIERFTRQVVKIKGGDFRRASIEVNRMNCILPKLD